MTDPTLHELLYHAETCTAVVPSLHQLPAPGSTVKPPYWFSIVIQALQWAQDGLSLEEIQALANEKLLAASERRADLIRAYGGPSRSIPTISPAQSANKEANTAMLLSLINGGAK